MAENALEQLLDEFAATRSTASTFVVVVVGAASVIAAATTARGWRWGRMTASLRRRLCDRGHSMGI